MGFDIKVEEPSPSGYEVLAVPISGSCAAAIHYVQSQPWGAHQLTDAMAILDLRARNRGLPVEWTPSPRSLTELLAELEHVTHILRTP
jgi:hypothetical protein